MKILEYNQVDPLTVIHLNLLCGGISLTPELAETIRYEDPRAFPFFCLYGQTDGILVGQVGVSRLPVMSIVKADEVGGLWAFSLHPSLSGWQIAEQLFEEAHSRMRAAGLNFSTLVANRRHRFYKIYKRLGYEDVYSSSSAISQVSLLPGNTGLSAVLANRCHLPLADHLFEQIVGSHLGFARRHKPFFPRLDRSGYLNGQKMWLIWKGKNPVGYALASLSNSALRIANLLLVDAIDPVLAVATIAGRAKAAYVQVAVDRLAYMNAYIEAGFQIVGQEWESFMVKPLAGGNTVDEFRQLYGVGTDRFLISCLDVALAIP